jgi:hydroxyacylglutathione hydrolase
MDVVALRAFADNYVYVLCDAEERRAAVVDPGDAAPPLEWLARTGRSLAAILVTHHHRDHVGGVAALLQEFPGTRVFAGAVDLGRVPSVTRALADGDTLDVLGRETRVLAVPGHTRGHVAYVVPDPDGPHLFSGDTLFGGTIGNLFEGTPDEMLASLRKIRALPPSTRIWCAHEYTRATMAEAVALDGENPRVQARMRELQSLPPDAPTVPLLLSVERQVNPYLRWDDPGLQARFGATDEADLFRRLCAL